MADPAKYREEAQRLRKEAATRADDETRKLLIEVADLCDRLAETIERLRRQRQPC
jgi:hypothetical protein